MKNVRIRPLMCAWLLALAATAFAQSKLPKVEFTDTTLDNGLRVIIAPEHTAPVFAISLTYNTGSRNEKQGRTGFAHLFEHMMFEGSANVGKGEHMLLVQNYGGSMNGSTNNDQTNYFEELPKNQLDMALFLESDRMRALNITPEYVAGFQRLGYRNLPVDTLVQLKALNITPEFVRSTVGAQATLPSVDQLVQMKIFGRRR